MYGNAFQLQNDRCHLGWPGGPYGPSFFAGLVNLFRRCSRSSRKTTTSHSDTHLSASLPSLFPATFSSPPVTLAVYFNGSSALRLSAVRYLENSIRNRAISFVSPTVTFESWRDYEVEARGTFVEVILTFLTTLSGRFLVIFAGNSHGIFVVFQRVIILLCRVWKIFECN